MAVTATQQVLSPTGPQTILGPDGQPFSTGMEIGTPLTIGGHRWVYGGQEKDLSPLAWGDYLFGGERIQWESAVAYSSDRVMLGVRDSRTIRYVMELRSGDKLFYDKNDDRVILAQDDGGGRLPSSDELACGRYFSERIGGFSQGLHWSNQVDTFNMPAVCSMLEEGGHEGRATMDVKAYARAVRSLILVNQGGR